MSFGYFLKNKISSSKKSRTEIIAQLNLYHDEFSNLDAITFSRWITNKTTPSAFKQVLIADFFNDDIIYFLRHHLVITKNIKQIKIQFNSLMNKIENSYSNINYHTYSDNKPRYLTLSLSKNEFLSLLGGFYKKFPFCFDLINIIEKSTTHECIVKYQDDFLISHVSFFKISKKNSLTISKYLNKEISEGYFVNLSYIENRDTFFMIKSIFLYHLYKNNIKTFTCIIRHDFLDLFIALRYEIIDIQLGKEQDKLYLVQSDVRSIISHPFILEFFLPYLEVVH
ncbi:hypothetical protein ACPV36_16950 [Photobacterium damselae]|uniref:hypothetical protein n=1 Tax=Photobacterium damselae TaxID=38293 RepID=UPI004067C500